MLADRQNSLSSIFDMGNEVAANVDPRERKEIESQLKELSHRFDNLDRGATKRMDDLQKAMVVAKEFLEKITPLLEWLDKSEKKIKDMELIPTDEEKIQQRIKEHSVSKIKLNHFFYKSEVRQLLWQLIITHTILQKCNIVCMYFKICCLCSFFLYQIISIFILLYY